MKIEGVFIDIIKGSYEVLHEIIINELKLNGISGDFLKIIIT